MTAHDSASSHFVTTTNAALTTMGMRAKRSGPHMPEMMLVVSLFGVSLALMLPFIVNFRDLGYAPWIASPLVLLAIAAIWLSVAAILAMVAGILKLTWMRRTPYGEVVAMSVFVTFAIYVAVTVVMLVIVIPAQILMWLLAG